MEPPKSKLKEQNISDEESSVDIISNMPDSVLSLILSFLPTTKEAVKTGILSKRWRYVWTSVDKLKFDSKYLLAKARKQLPRFVNKVLKLYQGNIKGFTLSGHDDEYNEPDVVSWVNIAVSRGVERLHLEISFSDTPKWPLSIFSCETLVDLRIWSLCRRKSMDIPDTPIFPCLKKLEVRFCDNGFFRDVISRCLALEHFIGSLDGTPIRIVSSSMKQLELQSDRLNDEKVVLCVPSLRSLNFYCALPLEFVAEEQLSSLVEAEIYFYEYPSYSRNINAKQVRDSFVRFIQTISNVKILRIRSNCAKFFNTVGHAMFVNLTKLKIESLYFEWRLLLSLMESSINLETVTLKKTSTLKKHKLAWKEPKEVPTCLSSSIKKISIEGYGEDELPMVKYVLRTAQILERVDIHSAKCYRDDNNWKSDMLQNLQKLPRASVRCEIFLV